MLDGCLLQLYVAKNYDFKIYTSAPPSFFYYDKKSSLISHISLTVDFLVTQVALYRP